jgi:TonB family protein
MTSRWLAASCFIMFLACAGSSGPATQPRLLSRQVPPAECIALTPADTVWPVDSLDSRPVPTAVVPPRYPPEFQSRGVEGKVAFTFRLQPSGRVDPCSVEITEQNTPGFEQAARQSLLSTYFQPPLRAGIPVFASMKQSISFRLGS